MIHIVCLKVRTKLVIWLVQPKIKKNNWNVREYIRLNVTSVMVLLFQISGFGGKVWGIPSNKLFFSDTRRWLSWDFKIDKNINKTIQILLISIDLDVRKSVSYLCNIVSTTFFYEFWMVFCYCCSRKKYCVENGGRVEIHCRFGKSKNAEQWLAKCD